MIETLPVELNTLFSAKKEGKKWAFKFRADLDELERLRHVVCFYNSRAYGSQVSTGDNTDRRPNRTYAEMEEHGRSYMVGTDVPMDKYRKSHSSYLRSDHWLAYAVEWAFNNPDKKLKVETNRLSYVVYMGGTDYVEIALPYHDRGGEKNWIVRSDNRLKKLLVNVD